MAELDEIIEQPSESERRIKDLSGKVRSTAEERDAEKAGREVAEAAKAEAERERDFYASFTDVVSTNPAAKDHKDDILTKVKAGYTVEDATFAVLGKAGKLGAPVVDTQTIAGGSSATTPAPSGNKSISEMTTAEKRAALVEAEQRGDISFQ